MNNNNGGPPQPVNNNVNNGPPTPNKNTLKMWANQNKKAKNNSVSVNNLSAKYLNQFRRSALIHDLFAPNASLKGGRKSRKNRKNRKSKRRGTRRY